MHPQFAPARAALEPTDVAGHVQLPRVRREVRRSPHLSPGSLVQCPKCSLRFTVPEESDEPPAPPPPYLPRPEDLDPDREDHRAQATPKIGRARSRAARTMSHRSAPPANAKRTTTTSRLAVGSPPRLRPRPAPLPGRIRRGLPEPPGRQPRRPAGDRLQGHDRPLALAGPATLPRILRDGDRLRYHRPVHQLDSGAVDPR